MNISEVIFGTGTSLAPWQMVSRAIVIFLISLVFIRISGRRSFGMRTSFDNIIIILLGSVLARAVAGASPFWGTVMASLALVLLHRLTGYIVAKSKHAAGWIEGHKILLYADEKFIDKNLIRALVREEDVMHSLRKIIQSENIHIVDRIYMERNGEITVTLKINIKDGNK